MKFLKVHTTDGAMELINFAIEVKRITVRKDGGANLILHDGQTIRITANFDELTLELCEERTEFAPKLSAVA